MANICTTEFVIQGKTEFIKKLYNAIGGDSNKWVGDIIAELGLATMEEINHCGMDLRGWWSCYDDSQTFDDKDEFSTIYVSEEAKWYMCGGYDLLVECLNKKYGEDNEMIIGMWRKTEEPGCGIYETNDYDGFYFPERYYAYISAQDAETYAASEEEVVKWVNEKCDTSFESFGELVEFEDAYVAQFELV